MGPQVRLHVAFLGETLAAHSATERFLFCVNTTDVGLEIAFLSKSLPARMAVVVFFSRMYLHVRVYVSLLSEAFPANLEGGERKRKGTRQKNKKEQAIRKSYYRGRVL